MKTPQTPRFAPLFTALVAATALCLASGCASTPSTENRLTCAKARDAGFFTVMFAAIGISFRVAEADTKRACAEDKPAAPAAPSTSSAGK